MTTFMSGWVEARSTQHAYAGWVPVVDIDIFASGQQSRMSQLFMELPGASHPPIVPQRGLPADTSTLVRREAQASDTKWGETWCAWAELMPYARADVVGEEWLVLLSVMQSLADYYGADNVRLIVWYFVNM